MNSFCWIAYHTTCSCKKLLFTMEINWRAGRQKLANFKVIFDLFISCFYFIQQQKYKLYYVTLMIISEIQSKRAHWSCYSSKVKAPADFSHHAILATWISLILMCCLRWRNNFRLWRNRLYFQSFCVLESKYIRADRDLLKYKLKACANMETLSQ